MGSARSKGSSHTNYISGLHSSLVGWLWIKLKLGQQQFILQHRGFGLLLIKPFLNEESTIHLQSFFVTPLPSLSCTSIISTISIHVGLILILFYWHFSLYVFYP